MKKLCETLAHYQAPLRDKTDILTENEEKMIEALTPPDVPLEML